MTWIKLPSGRFINLDNVMEVQKDSGVMNQDNEVGECYVLFGVSPYPCNIEKDSDDGHYLKQVLDNLVSSGSSQQWANETEDGLFED